MGCNNSITLVLIAMILVSATVEAVDRDSSGELLLPPAQEKDIKACTNFAQSLGAERGSALETCERIVGLYDR